MLANAAGELIFGGFLLVVVVLVILLSGLGR
jgi:hypothetical protein